MRPHLLVKSGIYLTLFVWATLAIPSAQGQTYTVLHTFTGKSDGAEPYSPLLFDSVGNLYGTTVIGGNPNSCGGYGCGTIYELSPSAGGDWNETLLYRFTNSKTGGSPEGGLVLDAAGNLFGAGVVGGGEGNCSSNDGLTGCGLIFEVSPTSTGWQESVLQVFNSGANGGLPFSGLIADSSGNLYGTTDQGGNLNDCGGTGCGTVFRLSPANAGRWRETVLHSFTGSMDGGSTYAPLIRDTAGNLYGTAPGGGGITGCCGVVFELSPTSGGAWKETVLHTFSGGADGAYPYGGLMFDATGNLYGTTGQGGNLTGCNGYGCGVAFELSPTSSRRWKETALYAFTGGADGSEPQVGLAMDAAGNLYGTTYSGGNLTACLGHGCGVIFKLSSTSTGRWQETVIHSFTGLADGSQPSAPLTLDQAGNLYGVTVNGGNLGDCSGFGCGVVFEIIP
jgi:uncharacterized repeat protein (TIGR03803 family)